MSVVGYFDLWQLSNCLQLILVYRTKTPEQHALFLRTASDINFDFI